MKRWLLICIVLLGGILLASDAFTATYDATGTWTYSTSNHWVDPGTAGCGLEPTETGTATITQTDNSVTLVIGGITYTGSVSGATYTLSGSHPEDGGTTTDNLTFTLTSSTSGSGTFEWFWSGFGELCEGGGNLTFTKGAAQPAGGGGDGGGGGCFIATAGFGSSLEPKEGGSQ